MIKRLSYIIFYVCIFIAPLIAGVFPPSKQQITDYQINLHNDTLWLYDGNRLVGTHIDDNSGVLKHGAFLDSLITNDNK